jgi:hypothetical protein
VSAHPDGAGRIAGGVRQDVEGLDVCVPPVITVCEDPPDRLVPGGALLFLHVPDGGVVAGGAGRPVSTGLIRDLLQCLEVLAPVPQVPNTPPAT